MSLTVESAINGYVIRDNDTGQILTIADNDRVQAAIDMLCEVNELIGEIGGRHDPARVRVLALPGDKWLPNKRGECRHPWVELREYSGISKWLCFCGAEFEQVSPGNSWEDEIERSATDPAATREPSEEPGPDAPHVGGEASAQS